MNEIEQAALRAFEEGRSPSLIELGGEEVVLRTPDLATSVFFADVVESLVASWDDVVDHAAAEALIANGLRLNGDRLTMAHAVSMLTISELDLKPFVRALDGRARDMSTHPILRADAAAGLMRFALCKRHWKHSALSALYVVDPGDDYLAGQMLCRLAALAFEQFHEPDVVGLLEQLATHEPTSAQATYELGVIQIGSALERNELSEIADGFGIATRWLRQSLDIDAERRDSRMYLLLAQILEPLARRYEAPSAEITEELREIAFMRQMWDAPVPDQEWLLPPHEAELDWVPLVDEIIRVSSKLNEASWLDAAKVLDAVLRLYASNRAVRPGLAGVSSFVRPWIEAAFVRERGLLAHLDQWLDLAGSEQLNQAEAQTLRTNIGRLAEPGAPPGKIAEGGDFRSEAVLTEITTGLSPSTATVVRSAAGGWWLLHDIGVVGDGMMSRLKSELCGKPDYQGEVADRFDRLLLLLLQFLKQRIDAQGAHYPYLKRIEGGHAPHENSLQYDLWTFLTATDFPEAERGNLSAGRADIFIPQGRFRFVIEVKRLLDGWSDANISPLLRQTTAYQQTDVRLGILAVLDLSDRPAGTPHMDQCLFLRERRVSAVDNRHAVVMRVPGNRRVPSDHWISVTS